MLALLLRLSLKALLLSSGSWSEKRLASLLLPRFVAECPSQCESAAICLGALACCDSAQPGQEGSHDAIADKALHALGAVCGVAAKSRMQKALAKALEHLLRLHMPLLTQLCSPSGKSSHLDMTRLAIHSYGNTLMCVWAPGI